MSFKFVPFFAYFFLIFSFFSVSQDILIDNSQEFVISNFKIVKAYSNKDKSKLTVKFDVQMLKIVENYNSHPYYMDVVLESEMEQTIYSKKDIISLNAKPDYKDKSVCTPKNMIVDIPYSEIKLQEGRHYVNFVLAGRSDYKYFGKVFSIKLFIDIPKIFDYHDQEISLKATNITADKVYNKLNGLLVTFDYNLKFLNYQTHGFADEDNKGQYLFYTKIYTVQNGQQIDFFSEKTGEYILNAENISGNIAIHIPYNKINIERGTHKILCEIFVSDTQGFVSFGKLAQAEVFYFQPVLYSFELDLRSMEVLYSEGYDVSSFVGRLFSKKGSDAGKGYPDVFWALKLGEFTEYSSSVNKNSFSLHAGKAITYITDDDPLSISCYDRDYTSFDDFIGNYKIVNSKGNFLKKYSKLRFNSVKSADFTVTKEELPFLKYKKIFVSQTKKNGVSGIFIETDFELSALKSTDSISISLIKQNLDGFSEISDFIDQSDSDNSLSKCGAKGHYKVFVPYFALTEGCNVGFEISTVSGNIKLPRILYDKPVAIPEINDTKLLTVSSAEASFNGIHGVNYTLIREIPSYYVNVDEPVFSSVKIFSASNLIVDTMVIIDKFNPMQSLFFIPYYKMQSTEVVVEEIVTVGNVDFIIGKDRVFGKNDLKPLSEVKFKALSVYFNDITGIKSVRFVVKYDNKQIFESPKSPIKKNADILSNGFSFRAYTRDEFYISVLAEYEYDLDTEIFSEKISVNELLKSKKFKMKAYGMLKKVVVRK